MRCSEGDLPIWFTTRGVSEKYIMKSLPELFRDLLMAVMSSTVTVNNEMEQSNTKCWSKNESHHLAMGKNKSQHLVVGLNIAS